MDASQTTIVGGNDGSGGNRMLIPQINDTTVRAVAADDSTQLLNLLINSTQNTFGLNHQLYLTVSSFNAAFQMPLLQCINVLVSEFDNIFKFVDKCKIQVPMEVVNLIDDGRNPDEFTRDIITNFMTKQQIARGKTDAAKSFRKHRLEELEQNFPDEIETYGESHMATQL